MAIQPYAAGKGLGGSKALSVGLGMLTGGPLGAAEGLMAGTPGGSALGAATAINKATATPDTYQADALQRRMDSIGLDNYQIPEIGSQFSNPIQRRMVVIS